MRLPPSVTAIFGLLDPAPDGGFTVTLATGGHPPAYHLTPAEGGGVRVEAVRDKGGMLVGAFAEAAFVSRTLRLAPGQGLLLYTDGLTEARTADGHMLADTGLTDFLARRPAPVRAGRLIDDTVALLGTLPDTERDDVALLALSVPTLDAAPAGIITTVHSAAAPIADVSVGQENRRP